MFTARVYLKHYLVDAFLTLLSVGAWFAISLLIGLFSDNGKDLTIPLVYLWSGMYILMMTLYTLVFLYNFILGNIVHHKNVSESKIGSGYAKYVKKPKSGQALDLLKDIYTGLDWISFRGMNKHLMKISGGAIQISLFDQTWQHRDKFIRATPQLWLMKNGVIIAKLPIL
jgi:hypothetical protein